MKKRSNRRKFGFALFAGATALLLLLAVGAIGPVGAQVPRIVTVLTCPMGCGAIEGYTIFGSYAGKEHPWLAIQAQETPGYLYNIRELAQNKNRWKNTIVETEDTIIQLFFHGGKEELKEFYPEPIKIRWKLLYGETWWTQGMWFVTLDPKIKTPADMKGKRIGLGLRTQSDWGADARIFLETGYGITSKNADIRHLGPVAASEAMLDGKVDIVSMGMGTDAEFKNWVVAGPFKLLEASGRKLYFVGISKEAIDKVNKRYKTTYQSVMVPKGTLKGQEAEFLTGVDRGYTAVHPEFPDDLAYEFTKLMLKLRPRIADVHAMWKTLTDMTIIHGLTEENCHPGAIKALKEAGLWDLAKKTPPMTYPE